MQTRTLWEALVAGEPGIILGVSLLGLVLTGAGWLLARSCASVRADEPDPDHLTVQQLKDQQAGTQDEWLEQRVADYRLKFRKQNEKTAKQHTDEEDARLVAAIAEIDWPTRDDELAAEETTTFTAITGIEPANPATIPAPRRPSRQRPYTGLKPRPRPVSKVEAPV
jgi:hypothetical protein